MNNIKKYKAAAATMEHFLGISYEEHNQYMYEVGLKWLQNKWGSLEYQKAIWERSRVFWQWWIRQWNIRCLNILESMGFQYDDRCKIEPHELEALLECYYAEHAKAFGRYPNQSLRKQIREEMKKHNVEVPVIRILINSQS